MLVMGGYVEMRKSLELAVDGEKQRDRAGRREGKGL